MDKFIETYGERPDGHGGIPTMTTRAQDTWDALRGAYEIGRGEAEDMADVGQATMDAIRAHAYPGWSPAQCPSEIVGDLRNECDELRAKLDSASKVVAALVQVARAAWHAADDELRQWISVDDRLPGEQGNDSEEVLCFLNEIMATRYSLYFDDASRHPWSFVLEDDDGDVLYRSKSYLTKAAAASVASRMLAR